MMAYHGVLLARWTNSVHPPNLCRVRMEPIVVHVKDILDQEVAIAIGREKCDIEETIVGRV